MIVSLTCERCGNFKRTQEGKFCNDCENKNRRDIKIIQEYLLNHPKASLADVTLDTGISMKVLNVMVKENLIQISPVND